MLKGAGGKTASTRGQIISGSRCRQQPYCGVSNTAVLHGFDTCNGSVTCECMRVITHLLVPTLPTVPSMYLLLQAPLAHLCVKLFWFGGFFASS